MRKAGTRKRKKIIIKFQLLINNYYYYKKIKGCSQKYGNKKRVTSGSGNDFGKVGSYEKRYAN